MAGYALHVNPYLHTSAVAAVYAAVGGLGGYHELGNYLILIVDILPAKAVAVLLLYGSNYQNLIALRNEAQILHDLRAVNGRYNAAFLIGTAAAIYNLIGLIALVGILLPVGDVAYANGVYMPVKSYDLVAGTHPAKGIALRVYLSLIKAKLLHFFNSTLYDALFLAALAGNGDKVPEELCHVGDIALCSFLDAFVIHLVFSFLWLRYVLANIN